MQVSIETTSGLERRMTVGIPADKIDSEVNKRLEQAAKTIRLNGFRKGRVPVKVVKQKYGPGVRQEVLGELMGRYFYEAVQQQDVKPAGQPSIEPKELAEGKDAEFVATFEVYPEVTLGDFSGFEITKLSAEVSEADVDTMIETLRKQQAVFEEVTTAAADGNRVNIDYVGTKAGEEFAGGKAQGQNLVLGSNSMIPGFEAGIVGMKAGEEKTLSLTFPADYHAEDLKGAAVEFKVKVNTVSVQKLPELNDEFFAKFGVDAGGLEKFREDVKANMVRELKNAAKSKLKTQIMDALIAAHTVELPKALIGSEIQALRNQMMQQFGGQLPQNFDVSSLLPDEMFTEQAERRVGLGLIIGEIVKTTEMKVDADRVRAMVDEMASTYQDPEEVVNYYYSNREMLGSVESVVLEDQVVDHILASAKVIEKASSYEEVLKPAEPKKA